jgi:serine/threonine protein phosphatase PrpC
MNAGAASDRGLLRESNEDRYWIDAEHGRFLVVDGIGGHVAGELAAQTAVEQIRDRLGASDGPSGDRVREAITHANNQIFAMAEQNPELAGMSCVLTLALVEDGELTVGHVGDSRLYLVWHGSIRKLTPDHSPVGEAEDAGELTEEEAMSHPRRNEVFRDVGSRSRAAEDPEFIEIRKFPFYPDAAILLCSDGLTDQLTAAEVREIVERYDGDAESVALALVEAANHAGGKDNITVLFAAGPEFRGKTGTTRARDGKRIVRPPWRLPRGRLAFLCYGVLLGMIVWAVLRAARG